MCRLWLVRNELQVVERCPTLYAAFLHQPPPVVVFLDELHEIIFLQGHLTFLALEGKLGLVHINFGFCEWRWRGWSATRWRWWRSRCSNCSSRSMRGRLSCGPDARLARKGLSSRFGLGPSCRSTRGFLKNATQRTYINRDNWTAYRWTAPLEQLALGNRPRNTFFTLRGRTRKAAWRFAGRNVDGVALVQIASLDSFIFDEFHVVLLLLLLGILDTMK